VADKAHILTDKKLEEMENRLSAIYSTAQKDIQKKADEYFDKFKKADEEKRKLVKQGKLTDEEYKKWRQGKIMYGKRFTAMKEDISKQLLNVNQTATAYINGELPEVYALNYNALAETVDGVGGYSFTLTDADTVKHLATTDKSLLPYRQLDPAKDIPWNMKKINSQVLQGIIQGESIPNISKRIMNVQEMNKDAAIRSARTIVTGAENKGRMDSYQRAQDDGIILEKEWIATNDSRTRDWHNELDGATKPIDEPFENAIGKIMFPGDPSADGANVYNCRCSLVSKIKGFKKVRK
jgi:SPP1 gp7 family putative phage head morphogenesis protein